jgi:GMP synthase (glutamine-hydrolysing)
MKRIYLLQFRPDEAIAQHEYGCFLSKLPYGEEELIAVNALNLEWNEDDILSADAVIIGGSGDYLISQKDIPEVVEAVEELVMKLVDKDVPLLGVCFGSQMLCHVLGGEVTLNEEKKETGVFEIGLHNTASDCPVFNELPSNFHVILGHKDHLTKLPYGAIALGSSERSPVQAFTLPGKRTYAYLFHPELNVDDLIWRLTVYSENYGVPEEKLKQMKEEYNHDISHAIASMQRFFKEIVEK